MDTSIELFPHTRDVEAHCLPVGVLGKNWTCIGFLLDTSGSMEVMEVEARTGYNGFLDEQEKGPDPAALTTVLFNHDLMVIDAFRDIRNARRLTKHTYKPDGMTALLDAMGHTIDSIGQCLHRLPEDKKPNRVIIVTLTDGLENSSKEYALQLGGREKINQKITHQREKYSWEFIFLGAGFDAVAVAQSYGIPQTHAATMHGGGKGMSTGLQSVNCAVNAYRMHGNGAGVAGATGAAGPQGQHYTSHLASNKSWGGHLSSKPEEEDEP